MTEEEGERILQRMAQKMADEAMSVLCGNGAFNKPRPTALRLTPSGGFEVVELRDDGSIIEPSKPCRKCGILLCVPSTWPWSLNVTHLPDEGTMDITKERLLGGAAGLAFVVGVYLLASRF